MSENTNETTVETPLDVPVVPPTSKLTKLKSVARRFFLPVVAAVAGTTALAVLNHQKRIDTLEDLTVDILELEADRLEAEEDTVVNAELVN